MDSVHHIWCPLFSQEFQDLPDGAETTLTFQPAFREHQTVPAVVVPKDLMPPSRARARKRKPAHRRAPEAA
ncbi:hypothetical protein F7F59_30420, partial [Escherichia coli]